MPMTSARVAPGLEYGGPRQGDGVPDWRDGARLEAPTQTSEFELLLFTTRQKFPTTTRFQVRNAPPCCFE
jgi:hypothetical protein